MTKISILWIMVRWMTGLNKPYAESCDQNRNPILSVIKPLLLDRHSLLEIGSGTGQHAVYFAAELPHLCWYTSDKPECLEGIGLWIQEARLENVQVPFPLDVTQSDWPEITVDAVFSANTLHIMSWEQVESFFKGISSILNSEGLVIIYGPFNYNYSYTSESNARFDAWLKDRDPLSGIRDFEAVNNLAQNAGLRLVKDYAMPANNRILCWEKHERLADE